MANEGDPGARRQWEPFRFDPTQKRTPKYRQLAGYLEANIRARRWSPGELMPGNKELGTQLGISIDTVRQALQLLRDAEYINIIQGSGTYVADKLPASQVKAAELRTSLRDYEVVAATLLAEFVAGDHPEGGKMQSEPELIDRFGGMARNTVRQAIQILRSLGLVETAQGRGMFSTGQVDLSKLDPKIARRVEELIKEKPHETTLPPYRNLLHVTVSPYEELSGQWEERVKKMRAKAQPKVIFTELETALTEEIAPLLQRKPGHTVVDLRRTRLLDEVPYDVTDYLADGADVDEFQWRMTRPWDINAQVAIEQTEIGERPPSEEEQAFFRMQPGTHMLFSRRVGYDASRRPLVVVEFQTPSDRQHFKSVNRVRRQQTSH